MSQPLDPGTMEHSGTSSARLIAVRLKSANRHIFRALLSLASAALLIRVMGMFNQIAISAHFGLGSATDAYFVAALVPLLIADLIGGAVEYSVIPVFIRVRSQQGRKQASKLFSTLLNILLVGTAALTLVLFIFRHQLIQFSAPGLDPLRAKLATDLTPFIFPALLLLVLISLLECILNAEGQFGWPAYAGMLVPLATIGFVLVAGQSLGIVTLCIGMVVGLCLQLCLFIVRAQRAKIVYRPIIDLRNPEVSSILIAAWPAFLSTLILQAGPLVDQIFASSLPAGSISALNYALKLNSVPVGVIFVSLGRAVLPYLSYQASMRDMKTFKETFRLYVWIVAIGTLILSLFIIVLAHPIVQILFQRGAFVAQDTNRTASTLIGFTLGLTPMSIGFLTTKAFNALGKTRILMYITIFSVTANAVFDSIFARLWQSPGIALATSAVQFCAMIILLIMLRRTIGKLNLFTFPEEILKVIWKPGIDSYYVPWIRWREKNPFSFNIFYNLRGQLVRSCIILMVFAIGVIGVLQNAVYTLRLSLGSIIILAFLRYRYALLMTWIMFDAFIGSSLPFFNGLNLDTALTAPTLLLMACMPMKQIFKRMSTIAFALVFLLWVLLSMGFSPIPTGTFLTEWLLRLDFVAISILTIQTVTTRKRMMMLIDAILLLCTLISLYGIYGFFTKQNGEFDGTFTSLFRISSIFGTNAPTLAIFLSLVIPLAIYRAFTLRGIKCIGVLVLILIFLATLVLTFTRAAFICVPLSIIVMSFLLPSPKMRVGLLSSLFAIFTLAFLAASLSHLPIFGRFLSSDVTTVNNRTYIWQALLNHFDPTRLLGSGLNSSDVLLTQLQVGFRGAVIGTSSHNLFLETLYDHGIIGLSLLVVVFLAIFVNLINGMRKASGDHRILFAAGIAALINMLAQCLDSNDIWIQGIGLYFWIIVALPFALCWSTAKSPETDINQESLNEETAPRMEAIRGAKWKQVSPV